jgi:hypothetical protein
MNLRKWAASTAWGVWLAVICLCAYGCESAQQKAADEQAATDAANAEAEVQSVAANSLGKESEVLLHGDLARNGHEEVLVANRFRRESATSGSTGGTEPTMVMRAALLEKNEGRWTELLRCDEHLKNANGYLGGFPRPPVTGWRLEYMQDANAGLEMRFTPMDMITNASATPGTNAAGHISDLDVRWNKSTKRYQSFDRSHERFLTEIPILETPESSLR